MKQPLPKRVSDIYSRASYKKKKKKNCIPVSPKGKPTEISINEPEEIKSSVYISIALLIIPKPKNPEKNK